MSERPHVRRCPVCRSEMAATSREMFCREKCRLVDLSRWLNEEYRIRGGEDGDEGGDGTVVHSPDPPGGHLDPESGPPECR